MPLVFLLIILSFLPLTFSALAQTPSTIKPMPWFPIMHEKAHPNDLVCNTSSKYENQPLIDPISKERYLHLGVSTVDQNGPRWAIDPDALQIGGDYTANILGQGSPPGERGSLGSLRISCHPYGNYDAGACLIISDNDRGREGSRMGIGAALETSIDNLSNYAQFENVGVGIDMVSPSARLVLQNVSYDASHVYAPGCAISNVKNCKPWTADQIAQLRYGMTITTNSVDPTVKRWKPGSRSILGPTGLYHSFIRSWDPEGHFLTITPGWVAFGGASRRGGQVPSSILDKFYTEYQSSTVLLGAEDKDFGSVVQIFYQPRLDKNGIPLSSLVHSLEYLEADMVNHAKNDYMTSMHGITLAYSGEKKPTSDSYGLFIAGGFAKGGGSLLHLTAAGNEREIDASSMQLEGKQTVGSNAGNTHEISNFLGQSDGNILRLSMWTKRESDGTNGWRNTSINLGLWVDGKMQNPSSGAQTMSGSPMARIAWNYKTNLGGINFLAENDTNIMSLKNDGSIITGGDVKIGGSEHLHGNLTVSGTIIQTLSTPTSSSAPCTKGEIEDDANYHYVCVAENRWKRVALSSF